MTTPLWCLVLVALLPYALSTLAGVYRMRQFEKFDNKHPRAQQAQLTGVGARALAAQQNAWEALPFFTAAVVVAHLAGADPGRTALWSVVYAATRVVHPIAYLANLDALRSLVFLVGLVAVIAIFVSSC